LTYGWVSVRVFRDMVFYDSLESLFQQVKTTLPPESIKYLKNVEQTLHLCMKPYKEYGKFKKILNWVNEQVLCISHSLISFA